MVSILILLDYLFLFFTSSIQSSHSLNMSQSLFYWIIYSYLQIVVKSLLLFNVSILILLDYLFLSPFVRTERFVHPFCLNPYFTGLSILIVLRQELCQILHTVSILILLDYLFLSYLSSNNISYADGSLNPYFTGLSILIKKVFYTE